MILETTFYILGIITMSMFLAVLLAIIAIMFKIRSNVNNIKNGMPGKVMGLLKEKNVEVASALGLTFAHFIMEKVKDSVDSKRKS